MITAVALGIPTRVVTNEAHAWVEVHNGAMWKRIDLGGAGGELASNPGEVYDSPPDPFAWPKNAERGDDLARRANGSQPTPAPRAANSAAPALSAPARGSAATTAATAAPSPGAPGSQGAGAAGAGQMGAGLAGSDPNVTADGARRGRNDLFSPAPAAAGSSASAATMRVPDPLQTLGDDTPDARGAAQVTLAPVARLIRGELVTVDGAVVQGGTACAGLSVSIVLMPMQAPGSAANKDKKSYIVGTVATDASGRFHQDLRAPLQLPIGNYDLVGYTLGDARCGRGTSR